LPPTIALTLFVIVVTWVFAIPVGIYSAVRQHTIGDYAFTFLGFTGLEIPDFLFALVLMYLLFDLFGTSVGGLFSADYEDAPWSLAQVIDLLKQMIVPGIVLGTAGTAALIRIMRNNLLDELNKPYVVTARAKRLPAWKAIAKYPVRVAINPFISSIGALLPAVVSGSVIVSVVISLPTLGPVMLEAFNSQRPQLGGTIILLLGALTVVGTLISDLLLVVVDPRIRLTGSAR
jgi:peptide/nickel transport system permease protein